MLDKLNAIKQRFDEVNDLIMQPDVISDQGRYIKLNREYKRLEELVKARENYITLSSNIEEAKDILANEKDAEMKEMAKMELEEAQPKLEELESEIRTMLIPKDPEDEKNAVLEIRGGTGGDEAGIFAGDLFRMYTRYIEGRGWKMEMMNETAGSAGGYKDISVAVTGEDVYGTLKYESGVSGHGTGRQFGSRITQSQAAAYGSSVSNAWVRNPRCCSVQQWQTGLDHRRCDQIGMARKCMQSNHGGGALGRL